MRTHVLCVLYVMYVLYVLICMLHVLTVCNMFIVCTVCTVHTCTVCAASVVLTYVLCVQLVHAHSWLVHTRFTQSLAHVHYVKQY